MYYRIAKHRYEIVIGEKGLAVLTNQLCNISVFNTALHRKIHNAANNHDISYLM